MSIEIKLPPLEDIDDDGNYIGNDPQFIKDNVQTVKLHAIEFAKWVSNLQALDDFWSMSQEAQEEAYEQFLTEQ